MKQPAIYIMTNKGRTVLYIGVTSDLNRRYYEHKNSLLDGFSKKYKCNVLIYYEQLETMEDAILREKKLKGWTRKKKELLIDTLNPQRLDLAIELFGDPSPKIKFLPQDDIANCHPERSEGSIGRHNGKY